MIIIPHHFGLFFWVVYVQLSSRQHSTFICIPMYTKRILFTTLRRSMKMISGILIALLVSGLFLLSTADITIKEAQDTLKTWYAELVFKDSPQPTKLLKEESRAKKKEHPYELR